MTRIVFATSLWKPDMHPGDGLAAAALERSGHRVEAAPWNGPQDPFEAADAVVVRSTWDYFHAPRAFDAWLARLEARPRVFNAPGLMRGNADKRYLLDLARRGAPLPPTRVVLAQGAAIRAAMDELGLDEAVVKPTVAGAALGFAVTDRAGADEAAAGIRGEALVQPVLREIAEVGEVSFVFFGGVFSHAVAKRPKPGDLRCQGVHGGTTAALRPPAGDIEVAASILRIAAPDAPLYARVDMLRLDAGPVLMEVELIEPELFFDHDPGAAGRFAAALEERLV